MNEDQLSELMAAYQKGDVQAFESLYRHVAARLLRYLLMLSRNPSRAEDLLQETFLHIHRSRRTYLPGRSVLPWAFAIARHVYLMDARKRARLRRRETALPDSLPEIPIPPQAEGLAEHERVQRALRRLPAEQVEALTLHHVWGFTFSEIGGILGIRAVTAKVRAFRGMKRLRENLGVKV